MVSKIIGQVAIKLKLFFEGNQVMKKKDFIVFINGEARLADWRLKKLEQELEEMDVVEQYALVADEAGYFECFNCGEKTLIYLEEGEVWRYGHTRKGEKVRYGKHLHKRNLRYIIQFEGTVLECIREEKKKIYYYALLPENLKRIIPLIRPPGNKKDN